MSDVNADSADQIGKPVSNTELDINTANDLSHTAPDVVAEAELCGDNPDGVRRAINVGGRVADDVDAGIFAVSFPHVNVDAIISSAGQVSQEPVFEVASSQSNTFAGVSSAPTDDLSLKSPRQC